MAEPETEAAPSLPAKTYFKIGEVARHTGLEPHVLRYWETEFRHVRPEKSRSGQRLYRREHIDRILEIKDLLYRQKYTIAGARRRLLHRHDKAAVDEELERQRSAYRTKMQERDAETRDALESIRKELVAIRRRINLG